MATSQDFPVFRKYINEHSYFKILSDDEFEEIKKLPSGYSLFRFKARILPDRNYISDMLYDYHLHWKVINEEEYERIRSEVRGQ